MKLYFKEEIKMENQKVKKNFVQRHKKVITVVGIGLVAAVASYYGSSYIYKNIFIKGAKVGAILSFEETIKWCDKTFPDIKLKELYDEWARLNPEQIVTIGELL
jgi:hypothetical protein